MTAKPMRLLSGIQPSGKLHLGNYFGMMKPAIELQTHGEAFLFIASYHALTSVSDPAALRRSVRDVALDFLACGLDAERTCFFRQSDVPEVTELAWLLSVITPMGLLERCHSYKDKIAKGIAASHALFAYPVLMAADILMFNAHHVPVGRDQVQHIEMARDIAQRFNHLYGEHFTLPEAAIEESVATLPGLDGRKMSKSYDNHIALFAPRAQLKKLVAGIVTDSRAPGEAKETEGSALFQIYQAFASAEETAALRRAYAEGIAWADAKHMLFERIDREIAPMREQYTALMAAPDKIEEILLAGAEKARTIARPFTAELRRAVGLRDLRTVSATKSAVKAAKTALPLFKQYREIDGKFCFKLMEPGGRVLLQSLGFDSPREAAAAIKLLHGQGRAALGELKAALRPQPGVSDDDIDAALQQLAAAA